jgi:protein-S-isoprenylcysteine O-methyltransferase Ste14
LGNSNGRHLFLLLSFVFGIRDRLRRDLHSVARVKLFSSRGKGSLMTTFGMILLSVAFLVIQFTLAALGWGGFRFFFSQPQFVALAILTVPMMAASFLGGINISAGVKEDRSNRWVIGALTLVSLFLSFFSSYTDRRGLLVFGGDGLRWIGVVLFTVGGVLRLWPVFVLGRRFSGLVAIQPEHELVTDGIYSQIRNPSYLGLVVNMLGWALTFRSGVGVLLAALTVPILIARIRSEERILLEHFGAAYDAYCSRTRRLIPWVY